MRITIKVKTNAGKNEVRKVDDSNFEVKTTITPEDGKANASVIEQLAKYFRVAKSKVNIIKGKTAHVKVVEIGGI
ncbi:MAG: DUF167 domain-containing protein [Rickettsiales bacterium]|nr:DUF167 domain-containing protein [Rickettsiales bacterium]